MIPGHCCCLRFSVEGALRGLFRLSAVVSVIGLAVSASSVRRLEHLSLLLPEVSLNTHDAGRRAGGEPVVHLLPLREREIGVVAAIRTTADGEQLRAESVPR